MIGRPVPKTEVPQIVKKEVQEKKETTPPPEIKPVIEQPKELVPQVEVSPQIKSVRTRKWEFDITDDNEKTYKYNLKPRVRDMLYDYRGQLREGFDEYMYDDYWTAEKILLAGFQRIEKPLNSDIAEKIHSQFKMYGIEPDFKTTNYMSQTLYKEWFKKAKTMNILPKDSYFLVCFVEDCACKLYFGNEWPQSEDLWTFLSRFVFIVDKQKFNGNVLFVPLTSVYNYTRNDISSATMLGNHQSKTYLAEINNEYSIYSFDIPLFLEI
jgi:hypothetical protein